MLDRIIKKDWGLMLPVERYDEEGKWIESTCRFIAKPDDCDETKSTSIHRHSCSSSITVVSGCVSVCFGVGKTFVFKCGECAEIPADAWHRVEFMSNDTVIVEDYNYVGDDYPIERYEGEGWPDE